jgi:hypothetical protein
LSPLYGPVKDVIHESGLTNPLGSSHD